MYIFYVLLYEYNMFMVINIFITFLSYTQNFLETKWNILF